MEYSGAGGELIREKNQKQKISWRCPFMEPRNRFQEPIPLANVVWARICKRLRNPGIDSKEPIPRNQFR